jgi:hypothetical protein
LVAIIRDDRIAVKKLNLENLIEIAEILIENLPFERLRMAGYTPAASPKYTKGEPSDERTSGIQFKR